MELLALLIALALYGLWGSGGPLQQDGWFVTLHRALAQWLSGSALQLVAVLGPALATLLLLVVIDDALFGLLGLALLTALLLWAFGRGNLGAALAEYLERWSRGDFQAAFELLQASGADDRPAPDVADPAALHALARQRLYYRDFERVFAVLFWFVALGAAGAIAYRLAALEHRHGAAPAAAGEPQTVEGEPEAAATVVPPAVHGGLPLMFWMDWVPARLLAVSYALVGDFDACLYRWRAALDDRALVAPAVLEDCGNAALQIGHAPAEETRESLISRGAAELESVVVLHRRALLVWLVVIALVSMIG